MMWNPGCVLFVMLITVTCMECMLINCSLIGRSLRACGDGRNVSEIVQPLNSTGHLSEPCSEIEEEYRGCLNGGRCYVEVVGKKRSLTCRCTSQYSGQVCQNESIIEYEEYTSTLTRDGILILVITAIVLVPVAAVLLGMCVDLRINRAKVTNNNKNTIGYTVDSSVTRCQNRVVLPIDIQHFSYGLLLNDGHFDV